MIYFLIVPIYYTVYCIQGIVPVQATGTVKIGLKWNKNSEKVRHHTSHSLSLHFYSSGHWQTRVKGKERYM
jgi:hypothetical protein